MSEERKIRSYIQTIVIAPAIPVGVIFFHWLFRGSFDRLEIYWKIKDTVGDIGVMLLIFAMMAVPLMSVYGLRKWYLNRRKTHDNQSND